MGIKELGKLIRPLTRNILISDFAGKKFTLDVSNYMYIYFNSFDSKIIAILKMIELFIHFKKFDVELIFVFDGKAPEEKEEERERRRLTVSDKINIPKKEDFEFLKKISGIIGIKCMESFGEAEMLTSALYDNGLIFGTISRDTDHFVYGVNCMITKVSTVKDTVECIFLSDILDYLKLDFNQFISMCILSGCDYSFRVRGIGIKKAIEMIRKYGTLEKFLEEEKETIEKNKPENFRPLRAYEIFQTKYKIEIDELLPFEQLEINITELVDILKESLFLTEDIDIVITFINNYFKDYISEEYRNEIIL